jgi:hypothetical protein
MIDCKKVLTLPQTGGHCWFNAIMTIMFFSQGMRNVLFSAVDKWVSTSGKKAEKLILDTFKDILFNKYVSEKNIDRILPEHILKIMHSIDPYVFYYDVGTDKGNSSGAYIRNMFNLLHIQEDTVYCSFMPDENKISVSMSPDIIRLTNKKDKKYTYSYNRKDILEHPKVIVFQINNAVGSGDLNITIKNKIVNIGRFDSKKGIIMWNGISYIVDAAYIANYNTYICKKSHAIAGVTCNSNRYVYNGWIRNTIDPGFKPNQYDSNIPCELMPYDWISDKNSYCINKTLCKLDKIGARDVEENTCFDFDIDNNKTYFAVRRDIFDQDTNKLVQDTKSLYKQIDPLKPCAKDYIRHKVTLDCIKCPPRTDKIHNTQNLCRSYDTREYLKPIDVERSIPFRSPKKVVNPKSIPKTCPPGKVLNPKTNRCILEKNIKDKKEMKTCPLGKVLNPKTNRCILEKNIKDKKEMKTCPLGKVLNPKTNRCILEKNIKDKS